MPQVKGEHRGALVNFLQARGVQSQEERVPAAQLKPTQAEYSPAKVASWDKGNVKLSERSILVSSDGHILDGHHQWVKAKMNGEDLNIIRLSKPIRELLPLVHEFPSSHTSKGATAPAQQLSAADAIMQTDPALDWDSSERHERDALLSAIKMTHKADRLNTVDKTFAELPPRLREMVESHLRQGYAKKAREAAEAAPSKQDQLKAKMLANRPRLKDGLDERLVMESLEKGRGTAFAPDTIKWAEAHGFATVTKATKKNPATVTITEAGRKHLASIAKPGDRIEYTTARGENVGATVEGTFRTSESNQLAYNARLDSGTPTQVAHEDARRVTKTVAPESTAPEHATVGVDNRELSEIVSDYDSLRASQGEGAEQITHIFDPPAKGDIVRLNEKSRVYHKDHGWMTPAEAREKIREWEDRAVQQGKDSLAGKNKNSDKVVLSFFDLSGEWSLPWEQAGYQVWRFDIQRDPEQGDVNNFSTDFFGDWFGDFEGKDIHAILAANPCTDFASSGARHFAAKDKDGRTVSSVKLVQQTLAAIEYFKPAVWALENPVGRIEKLGGLPPWRLSFDPNDVGETYTKKTLIWGRFNADLPVAPVDPVEGSKMHKQYGGKSLATKNARSVTPEGFAYAFFLANNAIDNPAMTIANKYDRLDPKLIQRAVEFGITEDQIDEAVQDHYYQELDDDAANEALRNLPDKIAEDLRTEAAPDQKELVDWGNATGIRFEDPGVKGVDRIVEKVTTENYGSPRELKDIVRGAFVVDSTQQAEEAVAAIKAHFTIAQDKGEKAVSGGYFDHKIIIKFPDGIMGEIQVVHEPMFAETKRVRKDGLYDKWRAIPGFDQENSPPEARKLEEQMIERYAKAAEGTSFAKAFSDAMSAYAARNSFAKSVWDRIEPTFLTSPRAGTQPPLSNTKANPLPPETPLATGRPSISKNDKPSTAPHIGDSSYGAKNRLVTKDRAEELRAKLRAKLATQLNSGIDPEILSMGTELAVFHIEAGARKFADFTKAMVADLGLSMDQAKRFLRGWYNGARDMMEDAGAPVGDMDAALSQEEAQAIMAFQILRGELATESQSGSLSTEEQSNASASPASSTRADDRNSDEGVSAGHLPGAEGERGAGISPAEQGGGSGTELRSGDESGTRSGSQVGRSANDQDRQASGTQERSGENGNRPSRRVRAATAGTDFRTSPRGLVREGSWKATASRNLDIVELVKKLDAEGRAATPEEQALLAKFTGWGASEIRNHLFPTHAIRRNADGQREIVPPTYGAGEWGPLIQRASELLKGQDLEEALQSTQYAHYTSPEVIRSIWDGLNRLGFGGGKILEPGMGIGNFYMLTPDDVHQVSHYTGVELDGFTAKIAKYLLPQESVIHGDYTKTKLPNGFFDVAMGNPPFANIKILDDPDYKKHRFSLHDYFFAKSIDKVRPGGMLVFVTSRYTMDKLDAKARQYIADRADLIGAVRLPQTAFKENAGTEVVTDVLFFQKRADGVAPGGQSWLKTDQITAGGAKFQINEYYKAHPEMVLGKHSAQGSMYSKNKYTVEPYAKGTIEAHFAKALQNLPSGVYFSAPKIAKAQAQAKTFERDFAPASSKEGGLYEKGGKLFVVDQGSGIEVEEFTSRKLNPNDKAWLKSYIGLRDALKEAQRAQLEDAPDWEKKLEALNKSYRAFVKKHGQLLAFTKYERTTTDDDGETKTTSYKRYHNQRLFDLDVESPLVGQLEKITDDDEIKEGAFLQGRTLNKPTRPKIESPQDALAVTLDEVGKVDLDYAANLLGKSRADLVSELGDSIFEHPSDGWQTSDEYLSGLVIDKLEEAQAAAAIDPKYERNVEALLKVQPKPLPHSAITVKLGQSWIRPEIVKQFVSEELGQQHPDISYEPATGTWTVGNANSRWMRSNLSDFGTPDRSPLELLDALLNNRSIKVSRTVDKKTVVDPEATAAANEAAKKISDRFKSWIWTDGKRAGELQDSYNRLFNNIAPRQFNGDHLTLPGLSANFAPHPHVKRAVWRIVQTGNTYLAHAVGAGKTAEQIISGMEQKRLGLIKKPMYVVPNHMLQQFASEFLELYPAAQIMVADEKSFHTDNRRRFMAQAALNDPDAIVVTHSSFGKLGLSAKNKAEIVNDMVAQLEDALEEAKAEGHEGKIKRSKLEKQIEQVKRRIEGKTSDKDQTLNFEDMGVDFLYVDEAHEFRKLDFATNRQAKGIDSAGSAKALDLYSKARWLQKQKPNRNLVLASGTPVTNTMAELFTVMRYMDEDALERDGIQSFDAWANMFGEMKGAYEQNAAGKYELVERFSKFVNVPELMKRFRQFADVLTSDQLGSLVQRPVWKDGIPKSEVVPASTHLERYMKETLNTRLETSRKWKPSKEQPGNPDPVINIITDARLASIDMRFALPGLKDDPGSKLNKMLDNIVSIYKATAQNKYDGELRKGAVQIVFSAVGFGEDAQTNRGFDLRGWVDKRLMEGGIKKSEIAWMSDANTHAKKDALQKAVRSGQVRVLIGSPKNMGTGLNVQRRLYALHYLSPPWYPSDVEQPHGRIIRQGNLHKTVEGYWYATKGTYDSTAWGMVSRKQKFIEQAMQGDDSVRVLEDISESSQYEMAAALAAGDERIIKVAGLSGDIERLERLKGAHADQQRQLRSDRNTLEKFELPRLQERVNVLEKASAAKGTGYEPFSMTDGKDTYTSQKEAGEHIIETAEQALNDSVGIPTKELGKLYGKFPITMQPASVSGFTISVHVGDYEAEAVVPRSEATSLDPVGIMTRIQNKVREIPQSLSDYKGMVREAQQKLKQTENKIGAPFEHESELAEKIAEREQLQAEMAKESEPAAPAVAASALVGDQSEGPTLSKEQHQQFLDESVKIVHQLLPGHSLDLTVAKSIKIDGRPVQGFYRHADSLIAIAYNLQQSRPWVLAHESVHAMKAMGLFTKTEWSLLVNDAWTTNPKLQASVRKRWGYQNLSDDQLQEEAVAEHFGNYFDLTEGSGWKGRLARRVLSFLERMTAAFNRITGRKDSEGMKALRIVELMRRGDIGDRAVGFGEAPKVGGVSLSVPGDISPASPAFEPSIEERWQKANGVQVDAPGFLANSKAALKDFVQGWSRHFEHLPNEPRFSGVREQFRKLEAAPEASYEKVVRHLTALVGKLNSKEYDVMKRKAVLDDLMWEADAEHQLPFGFTPETLREARINIDQIAATMPKVTAAIRARKLANRKLADEMVATGVLRSDQIKNPAYYRHMVLDYARAQIEAAQAGGTVMVDGKPVRVRTPYWARRKGSQMDINSNLLEAEADWMLKAHTDIQTARTLNWIKDSEHNIREQLRSRAKSENDELYAEALKNNPEARKEDGRLRNMMRYGFDVVKSALESTDLNIPPELQAAADSILAGSRDTPTLPLLGWMIDEKKPGADGAGMVLAGIGGRKKLMRTLLAEKFADPEDIAGLVERYKPEGFVGWQPREGQHLFTGKTVPEHILDMFVSKLGEQEYPGVDKLEMERALGQIRPQLVVGGERYTMVIPKEVAATLNDFGDKNSHNLFLRAVAGIQGAWKIYTLINPRRWFKYNFNNMTGDLDAIIGGKPGALLKLPQAWRELWAMSKGAEPTDAYKEAIDRGVFQAGITRQEVPDINQFKGLRHLERQKGSLRPDRLAMQAVANIWGALKGTTQFRESLFRYAAYLKFKEEMDAGKPQLKIGYGASNPAMVNAIQDPADRAALLARELVGDYGDISVFGQRMRRYVMPFWSWPEMNTKRYFRLLANAFRVSNARGLATTGFLSAGIAARSATTMTIRMALVFALINIWNRWLHKEDEDKLDDQQKHQLHLILGHDSQGQVYTLRMQGALSDVLDELGFADTAEAFKNWEDGKGTFGEVALATPKAIVNRLGPGNWNPLYMEPIQLALREKLWPDMFKPRTIHDRERDVAQTFSLENEYDWAAGKPSQGYGRSWLQSFAYKRDPGEMAYNNTRDLVGQFLKEKEGLDIGRANISPRSEALRDYKMALRYGDVEAAQKALKEYAQYDGTVRGLKQSIKAAAPLHALPKRDRRAFVESLNDQERSELIEAQQFYEETYLGKMAN
jgi:N12 class adenine-specific DNA methylase